MASRAVATLTPELIVALARATGARISPDGAEILFERDGAVWRDDTLVAAGSHPRWSPDGRSIAWIGQEPAGLYVLPGAKPLVEGEVESFAWSPDGTRIAHLTKDKRLYVGAVPVVEGLTVHEFDWSPGGDRLVIAASPTPSIDDELIGKRLSLVSAEGGDLEPLAETPGYLFHPRFSPDGRRIAWIGATRANDPWGSIFVKAVDGGPPEDLLVGYEGTPGWLGWLPGRPDTLVFAAYERQATVVRTLSLADREPQPLLTEPLVLAPGPDGHLDGPSFSADGRRFVFAASSRSHPSEVFLAERGSPPRRVTSSNPELEGIALAEQEIVRWRAPDGLELEGVLVKPLDYEEGRRYPTVIQVHGGPDNVDLDGWHGGAWSMGQLLAAQGFATLYPNYRGSLGRGVAFTTASHRDLGGAECDDVVAGLDHLIELGLTDPGRVAIIGWSHGGFHAAWGATYRSERFRAAVVGAGITNWISYAGTAEGAVEEQVCHWDVPLYEAFELYLERSPIRHVGNARTPTLILHGKEDPWVPVGQAQELYRALRWRGVPVELVLYPGEGHSIDRRENQLDRLQRVLHWLDTWLA